MLVCRGESLLRNARSQNRYREIDGGSSGWSRIPWGLRVLLPNRLVFPVRRKSERRENLLPVSDFDDCERDPSNRERVVRLPPAHSLPRQVGRSARSRPRPGGPRAAGVSAPNHYVPVARSACGQVDLHLGGS